MYLPQHVHVHMVQHDAYAVDHYGHLVSRLDQRQLYRSEGNLGFFPGYSHLSLLRRFYATRDNALYWI